MKKLSQQIKFDDKGLVSIIVPVYNAEKFLDKCIDSIVKQTYKRIEIILVEDASTDSSLYLCRSWKKRDNRIRLIVHDSNLGVSASRNDALLVSTGDYLTFIDADDYVDENFIYKLLKGIQEVDIAICGYEKRSEYSDELIKEFLIPNIGKLTKEKVIFHTICTNMLGTYMCNKIIRHSMVGSIKFDTSLSIGEDMVFLIEYMKKCSTYTYINEPLYKYRMNQNSALNKLCKKSDGINMIKKWESAINSAKKVKELLAEESMYIGQCSSYRCIRSSLWVMFHMIIEHYYDSEIAVDLKNTVNIYCDDYSNLKYGTVIQNIAVRIMRINPRILYYLGISFEPLFHKKILKSQKNKN